MQITAKKCAETYNAHAVSCIPHVLVRVDPCTYSYFARCIPVWNSLPLEAVNDLSLSVFKATVTVINIILLPTA